MKNVVGLVRAKYWLTELKTKVVHCGLQLFGHDGYRSEYWISHRYRGTSFRRLYAGTHAIMKVLIARSL